MARKAAPAALIALLAFAVMAPCLGNGFTNWDDPIYVTGNPLIRDVSPGGVLRIFTELGEGIYAPVAFLGLAVQYALFGLDPFYFHLTSLLLHMLNSLCVLVLAGRLSRRPLAAFAAAALFAVHPLHVENVAWVTDQADLWATFFFLAAFIAYAAKGPEAAAKPPFASLALFLAAILSKSPMFTLPLVLIAYDAFRDGRLRRASVLSKWPFFALAAGIILLTIRASNELSLNAVSGEGGLLGRALLSAHALVFYLTKWVAPWPLSALYPYSPAMSAEQAVSALLVVALALSVFRRRRERPALAFGAFFFLVTIVPALPWMPSRPAPYADRYFYLPSVGLFFLLGEALAAVHGSARTAAWLKKTVFGCLAAVIGVFGVLSFQRCGAWRDSFSLWQDATRQYPDRVPLAHLNLGSAHYDAGHFPEAMRHFERSVAIDPTFPNGYLNRGGLRFRQGDTAGAMADYAKAVALKPDFTAAYGNRAITLNALGRHTEALADIEKAIALKPKQAFNYNVRGDARMGLKAYADAFADYSTAIALDPYFAESYNNRGILWASQGQSQKAVGDFSRAIALAPAHVEARYNRAVAYEAAGERAAAAADLEAVLRLSPGLAPARERLEALRAKGA